MRATPTTRRHAPRLAFTLVELLVVIAIIAVLAALVVGATMRVIGVQAQKNTQTLVQKVASSLNQQMQALFDQARVEPMGDPNVANSLTNLMNMAGGDTRRARVIWAKLRLKQQFPMTFAEAQNPDGGTGILSAEPAYAVVAGAGAYTAQQQGVCLYLALKNNRRGATFDPDTLSPQELANTSVNGIKYIMDAWKAPLQFVRWAAPNDPSGYGNAPQAFSGPPALDLQDPEGILSDTAWNSAAFTAIGHPVISGQTYDVSPYVYSTGGPSGLIVYSWQLLSGG
jgi:prepilin-type N-terminal cleavage/methylation domain-containing protein